MDGQDVPTRLPAAAPSSKISPDPFPKYRRVLALVPDLHTLVGFKAILDPAKYSSGCILGKRCPKCPLSHGRGDARRGDEKSQSCREFDDQLGLLENEMAALRVIKPPERRNGQRPGLAYRDAFFAQTCGPKFMVPHAKKVAPLSRRSPNSTHKEAGPIMEKTISESDVRYNKIRTVLIRWRSK